MAEADRRRQAETEKVLARETKADRGRDGKSEIEEGGGG